jgi:hypothetical protein
LVLSLIAALAKTNSAVIGIFLFWMICATIFAITASPGDGAAAAHDWRVLVPRVSAGWWGWIPWPSFRWGTSNGATTDEKLDSAKPDHAKLDPAKLDSAKFDPAKFNPAKFDPADFDAKLALADFDPKVWLAQLELAKLDSAEPKSDKGEVQVVVEE